MKARRMTTRARRNEDGVTLIELAVVMMLMAIVATMLLLFLDSVMRVSNHATNNSDAEKAVSLALRPVTENIRGTATIANVYPVTSSCTAGSYPTGYPNCLSVTVLRPIAGQLTCRKSVYTYGLKADGILREDRTDFALVGGTCTVTSTYTGKPMLKNIVNGSQPLFTYFDRFGNKLDPAASGQTTVPFLDAVTIRVTLNVRYETGSPLLSYTSDLALRNNR
jgi:prepilin-type N-terminal cleavage/methylation domain-containing protein